MKSVWSDITKMPQFDSLNEDKKTDVLIIGGGIAGVLCAYMLKKRNVDYILVEANRICSGITKNTTAKISVQHGLIYDKILKRYGDEKARMYFEANTAALQEYRKLCRNIDCDFEEKDSFVYSLNDRTALERELLAIQKIGGKAEFLQRLPLPISTVGAVSVLNQAQFNPLMFLSEISKGLHIYENTRVRELVQKNTAITSAGKIKAEKIIVATHFPFINKHGSYFIKMHQDRSYVIALDNAPDINGMYVDESDKGMSFRTCGGLLLLGGGGHRTGKNGGGFSELESFARRNYPCSKEKYRWATQDCMTLDSIPYIGRYSKNTADFYTTTGFNKWGMTSAMLAATILADAVTEKDNPFSSVFEPSRTIIHPQLALNAAESVTNLITISKKRCPHLGCALKWNRQEHSWDCPCHGSRFTEDGKLIDNPATGNIKKP